MSHFEGHFEGAKTFDPLNLGVKKVEAPSKCPKNWLIKILSHKQKLCPAVPGSIPGRCSTIFGIWREVLGLNV